MTEYCEWFEMDEDEMRNEELIAAIERMIIADIINENDESEAQS